MWGLILAALYLAWQYLFGGSTPFEASFIGAAGFLYGWYWFWSIVQGVILILTSFGIVSIANILGSTIFGKSGLMFGKLSAGLSMFGFMVFAIRSALLIIGSYLLQDSGTAAIAFAEFDTKKLILGAILILIGIVLSKANSD